MMITYRWKVANTCIHAMLFSSLETTSINAFAGIAASRRITSVSKRRLSLCFQRSSTFSVGTEYESPFRPRCQSSTQRGRLSTFRLLSTARDNHHSEDIVTTLFDEDDLDTLQRGIPNDLCIVKQYNFAANSFDMGRIQVLLNGTDPERLQLTPHNITLPIALMMADSVEYQSISKARKACRKGNVLVHRGPMLPNEQTGEEVKYDPNRRQRGRVGDRVYPGDVIAKQIRMGTGSFPIMGHGAPPFALPVVYEDDFFAIVNKPDGVVVMAQRKGGHGIMTVRSAIPFALTPSKIGTYETMRRPQAVHRLDKPTSGLLVIAKTKPAMRSLAVQFQNRVVRKQYTAIVNGIPLASDETSISSKTAFAIGVDVDPKSSLQWQLLDSDQEGKHAITVWRTLGTVHCDKAINNTLTLVELKPKTGRFHQLRRHMAWDCKTAIVGDVAYDEGHVGDQIRGNGLFLCSSKVTLEHPYYNTEKGRQIYDALDEEGKRAGGKIWMTNAGGDDDDGTVMITVSIDLPKKFKTLMAQESVSTISAR